MPPGGHFFDGSKFLNYFCRRSSSDHFYQVIINSNHLFFFKLFVYYDKLRPQATIVLD